MIKSITVLWWISAFNVIWCESSCKDQDHLHATSYHQWSVSSKKRLFSSHLMSISQIFKCVVKWTSCSWGAQIWCITAYSGGCICLSGECSMFLQSLMSCDVGLTQLVPLLRHNQPLWASMTEEHPWDQNHHHGTLWTIMSTDVLVEHWPYILCNFSQAWYSFFPLQK